MELKIILEGGNYNYYNDENTKMSGIRVGIIVQV